MLVRKKQLGVSADVAAKKVVKLSVDASHSKPLTDEVVKIN